MYQWENEVYFCRHVCDEESAEATELVKGTVNLG